MERLLSQNWLAFVAHLVTLIGVIITFAVIGPKTTFVLTREGVPPPGASNQSLLSFDPKCNINFPRDIKVVGTYNVQAGIIAFFVITICAHFFYATDGFGSGLYSAVIEAGWNWFRWLEQGLSASIMTWLVASADGTRDFPTLVALSVSTIALQILGLSNESMLKVPNVSDGTGILNTVAIGVNTFAGWLLYFAIFFVILYNFFTIVSDVNNQQDPAVNPEASVPAWLYFIGPLQLVYYGLFGLVQLWQIMNRNKGITKPFAYQESWYIFLSFAAKLSLAAGLAQGLAFRQLNCPNN